MGLNGWSAAKLPFEPGPWLLNGMRLILFLFSNPPLPYSRVFHIFLGIATSTDSFGDNLKFGRVEASPTLVLGFLSAGE